MSDGSITKRILDYIASWRLLRHLQEELKYDTWSKTSKKHLKQFFLIFLEGGGKGGGAEVGRKHYKQKILVNNRMPKINEIENYIK